LGPELLADVTETVVTRHAAPVLELRVARLEIELVVNDQELVGRNREEVDKRADRTPRFVHVGRRLHDADVAGSRDVAREPRLARHRHRELVAQKIDEPEPRVVSRRGVAAPRIAEPCNDSYR